MKVLHINDYPAEFGGGAEVMMAATVSLLRSHGVETGLFTGADLPDRRLTPRRYISNPIAMEVLAARLRTFAPDVVHLHNFYHLLSPGILATLAAHRRARPIRIVMTAHDYHLPCPNSGGTWFDAAGRMQPMDAGRELTLGAILSRRWDHRGRVHSALKVAQHLWNYRMLKRHRVIDLVLCPSRFMRRMIASTGLRTRHVPHPSPHLAAADVGRRSPLQLVFAGRVEPEKGIEPFLESLPGDYRGRLTVIGDGSRLDRCRAIVFNRGLSDRVDFLGRLPHEEAIAIIARCHVLALPSVCLENYPLSLVEALAARTNIMVSDRGGMREIVDESGVGFLIRPGDPSSLARALEEIDLAFRTGSLNSFDVSGFLRQRDAQSHLETLLDAYAGGSPAA